ncbi:MAG: DUF4175 family protein [Elusimicrobia bacterium]|nr:DUF4175 family protein [Elusimicrobiota bacterium]
MIEEKFRKAIKKLWIKRSAFEILRQLLKSFVCFSSGVLFFSIIDYLFPLVFELRKLILILVILSSGTYFLSVIFLHFKKGFKKFLREISEKILFSWELMQAKEKLTNYGISSDLINAEIEQSFNFLGNVKGTHFARINFKMIIFSVILALFLFVNKGATQRILFPEKNNFEDFVKLKMRSFAISGESWKVVMYSQRIKPVIFIKEKGSSWQKKSPIKDDGKFVFKIEQVLRPFSLRFKWKDLSSRIFKIDVFERPRVIKQEIFLTFPKYLGIKDTKTTFGGISAFPETVVKVVLTSNEELSSGFIEVETKSKKGKIPLKISGKNAVGSFKVFEKGFWKAQLVSKRGIASTNPVCWPIEIVEDLPPEIAIFSPAEDLIIGPSFRKLEIEWWAEDDFGIKKVLFLYKKNFEKKHCIEVFSGNQRQIRKEFDFKIPQNLKHASVIEYWFEAQDTSGKRESCEHFVLKYEDWLVSHRKAMEKEKKLKDEIFSVYSEQLELNSKREQIRSQDVEKRQSEISRKLKKLSELADALVSEMKKDPLYDAYFLAEYEGIRRGIENTMKKSFAAQEFLKQGKMKEGFSLQNEILDELERLSLLSEDVFKRSSMQNLSNVSEEAENLAQNLEDLLKEGIEKEKLGELMKLTRKIEDMLSEIEKTIKEMPRDLPEEFVNQDSLKKIDFNQTKNSLKSLRNALLKGDIDRALSQAKELLSKLSQMKRVLKDAMENVPSGGLPEGGIKQERNLLDEIITQQRKLLQQTRDILSTKFDEISQIKKKKFLELKKISSQIKKSLTDFYRKRHKKFGSDAGKLSSFLYDLYRNSHEADRLLSRKAINFEKKFEEINKKLKSIYNMSLSSETLGKFSEVSDKMDEFFEVFTETQTIKFSEEEKKQLQDFAFSQDEISKKTDDLTKKVYEFYRNSAQFPQRIISNLKEAKREMQKSKEAFANFLPQNSVPSQEKAIYLLEEIGKNFSQLSFVSGGASKPGKVPSCFSAQRSISGGGIGFNVQDFEIPVKKSLSFDRILRELQDIRKGPLPKNYRKIIEDYYDELSK